MNNYVLTTEISCDILMSMIQIGRMTIGNNKAAAVLSSRTLTEAEYKKLTDKELMFLFGLEGVDAAADLANCKDELALIFEKEPTVKVVSQETDEAKKIKQDIADLQAKYKTVVGNSKKLVVK